MSIALRLVEYKTICYLRNDEWPIVEKYFHENEDGTFYVNEETLKEAIADAKKDGVTIPKEVINGLRKAIEEELKQRAVQYKDDFGGINFVLS